MDSEYKQRISLYLDKETVEKMNEAIKKYGYRSRNDFVSSAVDNLVADRLLGENDTVISEKLSKAIENALYQSGDKRKPFVDHQSRRRKNACKGRLCWLCQREYNRQIRCV